MKYTLESCRNYHSAQSVSIIAVFFTYTVRISKHHTINLTIKYAFQGVFLVNAVI